MLRGNSYAEDVTVLEMTVLEPNFPCTLLVLFGSVLKYRSGFATSQRPQTRVHSHC